MSQNVEIWSNKGDRVTMNRKKKSRVEIKIVNVDDYITFHSSIDDQFDRN